MTALTVARRNNPDDGRMPGFGMDGCRSWPTDVRRSYETFFVRRLTKSTSTYSPRCSGVA